MISLYKFILICVSIDWLVDIWVVYSLRLCTVENKEQHGCILKGEDNRNGMVTRHSYKILESRNYDNKKQLSGCQGSGVEWRVIQGDFGMMEMLYIYYHSGSDYMTVHIEKFTKLYT